MNPFFQSVADANRAQCARLGLAAAELYGTPPSAEEAEVHYLIKTGLPAEAVITIEASTTLEISHEQ